MPAHPGRPTVLYFHGNGGSLSTMDQALGHLRKADFGALVVDYRGYGLSLGPPEWQAYHSSYHTSAAEVGKLAAIIQPRLLILNHLLPFGRLPEEVRQEAAAEFKGEVMLAEDLGIY